MWNVGRKEGDPAFSMLGLARHDPAGGAIAAGQAVLANFQGSGFTVHYLLMGAAGLLVSTAMLRSTTFSRAAAVA